MLSKLLSMLVAGKGGAVAAAAIIAGATSVSVATTTPETIDGLRDAVANIAQIASHESDRDEDKDNDRDERCGEGKPVVVAQRNAADKMIRDAFRDEHKRLEHLRGGKDTDHDKANAIVKKADGELKDLLRTALDAVARETLGREGHIKPAESTTPVATATATATPTPTPTVTPTATTTPVATATASAKPSCSPKPSPTKVELTAKIQLIVDAAKAQMKAIVDKAAAEIAKLPARERGKDEDRDNGKQEERGKSEEHKDADHGKASEHAARPSPSHARP